MTERQDSRARWMAGVVIPVALVVLSLAFLAALAVATLLGSVPDRVLQQLFGLGVGAWVLGVGWSIIANAERKSRRA